MLPKRFFPRAVRRKFPFGGFTTAGIRKLPFEP